jgi:hypothetical protein
LLAFVQFRDPRRMNNQLEFIVSFAIVCIGIGWIIIAPKVVVLSQATTILGVLTLAVGLISLLAEIRHRT